MVSELPISYLQGENNTDGFSQKHFNAWIHSCHLPASVPETHLTLFFLSLYTSQGREQKVIPKTNVHT